MADPKKLVNDTAKAVKEAKYLYGIEVGNFKGEVWISAKGKPEIIITRLDQPALETGTGVDFAIRPSEADVVVGIIKNLALYIETNL